MSSSTYRSQLERLQKEKAALEAELAGERKKFADLSKDISRIIDAMRTTKTPSMLQSKQRELVSKQSRAAQVQKKIGDLEKKLAVKVTEIGRVTKSLHDAEKREEKQRRDEEAKHRRDMERQNNAQHQATIRHVRYVNDELEQQIFLEGSLQSARVISASDGKMTKVSPEAREAARGLLSLYEAKVLPKKVQLIGTGLSGQSVHFQVDQDNIPFEIPVADVQELAHYGVVSLMERRWSGRLIGWDLLLLPERLREAAFDRTRPEVLRIFYSWQSWTPGGANRHFISDALEKAVKELLKDDSIEVEPVIDRDTLGRAGSVDIASTIFEKIDDCHIFLCDATIVTPADSDRAAPNPNVMLELGYAAARLGWERIICVVNTSFGGVDLMPFDLRTRRLLPYSLLENSTDKASSRQKLTQSIHEAIRIIIEKRYSSL
ncbi:MAG: hypothetical protein SNJ54_10075 [Anaerolineae bacterium]